MFTFGGKYNYSKPEIIKIVDSHEKNYRKGGSGRKISEYRKNKTEALDELLCDSSIEINGSSLRGPH